MGAEITGDDKMFSHQELEQIRALLVEKAMEMDDDGREGAFDASPLAALYKKVNALCAIAATKGGVK